MTTAESKKLEKVVTYGPFFWTVGVAVISAAFGIGATFTSMRAGQEEAKAKIEKLEERLGRFEDLMRDVRERTVRTEEQAKAIRDLVERIAK
ncbi:MAG: hypothetical protein KF784_02320 [Fimbriimonadaceae bacterium]|nr:hypothetical protein [Fimbriimonadaceae bacterium]